VLAVKKAGSEVLVLRRGLSYPAYPTGSPVRYVPGLDGYIAGDDAGRLHWISLYDALVTAPAPRLTSAFQPLRIAEAVTE
jgi:hypothetical protein